MVDISRLSIGELKALNRGLTGLIAAGEALEAAGVAPRFDMTPGRQVRILTGIYIPASLATREPAPPVLLPEAAAEAPAAVIPDAAGAPDPVEVAVARDPILAHLLALHERSGTLWSWAQDVSLMQDACDGLDLATIAIRMERPPAAVKARFEQLTNRRAFGREAVRGALRRLAAYPEGFTLSPEGGTDEDRDQE